MSKSILKKSPWPPTKDQIMDIASSALNTSQDKDVKVLVYWDNPTIMIFDPIHFAQTKYIQKNYTHNERSIEVNIGKED
mgnify:FL=1|tara:strand:- start:174 stop:410 length:237 start_codon:yes stop_codon:yes gene_type:complete